MKHFISTFIFLVMLVMTGFAQSVPMGMKYQAVARDLKGQIIPNQDLQLKISLYSGLENKEIAYAEIHKVITNQFGLFSLTVGEGIANKGSFKAIPWSTEDVWMEVAIQTDDETEFVTISNSKMLSVPYAFHAATANEFTGGSSRGPGGVPSQVWSLFGNSNTDPTRDKLGTTDFKDLVIVTNDIERLRVTAAGNINIANDLEIGDDLTVKKNVSLNTVGGETINYGDFTVEDGSSTLLTGDLTVDEATDLNSTLNVDGATDLNSTLTVDGHTDLNSTLNADGAADFNNTLNVDGKATVSNSTQSTDETTGALVVTGGVGIGKNLNVGGNANFDGSTTFGGMVTFDDIVEITDDTQSFSETDGALIVAGGVGIGQNLNVGGVLTVDGTNSGFMAKIENENASTGDGLEIKLGKTHPAWNGSDYLNLTNPGTEVFDGAIATVEGWINGDGFEITDILTLIPAAYIAGTACNLVNFLTDQLNDAIGLPASIDGFQILPALTIVPEIDLEPIATIGPYGTPAVNFPTIEVIPAIPDLPCGSLPSFSVPVISFVDVSNSLTNDNQFVSFKDMNNRELGSIRAEAVSDWQLRYFDGTYFVNLLASVVGLDFVGGIAGAISEFTNISDSYNKIGVEYNSGHGDYAEWLERINPSEIISAGDIVGVQGGKITKDLSKAEQVMAVSYKPIVLGNTPKEGLEGNGNKIAFMGQIPVKVQGPVTGGDYIIGNQSTPGYGVAVHPSDVTADQVYLTVGRSWETNLNPGPKMVNTVIGVDNGNFLKIIQDNQNQMTEMDTRVRDLEAKMNALVNGLQKFGESSDKLEKENAEKMEAFKAEQKLQLEQRQAEKAKRNK